MKKKMEYTDEEINNEVWKDISEYEGIYQVSDLGRVKTLDRFSIDKYNKKRSKFGKILKQCFDKNKYLQVALSKNGKSKVMKTHRLVISTFTYTSELHVDHINGVKDDNRLKNLRYCTNRENSTFYFLNKLTTSTHIGVFRKSKNKWVANIRVNGKQYNLGHYDSEIEASEAYKNALYNWENFNTIPDFKKIKDIGKVLGITWRKSANKWQVTHEGKYIGLFESKEEAIIAQNKFKKHNVE